MSLIDLLVPNLTSTLLEVNRRLEDLTVQVVALNARQEALADSVSDLHKLVIETTVGSRKLALDSHDLLDAELEVIRDRLEVLTELRESLKQNQEAATVKQGAVVLAEAPVAVSGGLTIGPVRLDGVDHYFETRTLECRLEDRAVPAPLEAKAHRKLATMTDFATELGIPYDRVARMVRRLGLTPVSTGKYNTKFFDREAIEALRVAV